MGFGILCIYFFYTCNMRTTIEISPELLSTARKLSGIKMKKALIQKALESFIELESSKKLSSYFGSIPDMNIDLDITRQR